MAKKKSAWNRHVAAVMKANRGKSFKSNIALAKRTYKQKKSSSSKKSSPTTKTRKSSSRKGGNRMGKGKNIQQLAFKWIRLGALAAPAIVDAVKQPDIEHKIGFILKHYTGFDIWDGQWRWEDMVQGWGPYLAANIATHGIPKITSILRRL